MSLFSRTFVRGLRRRVSRETKQHPQWKIEARATRKSSPRVAHFPWRAVVPLAAIAAGASGNSAVLALPFVLAWSTILMFARAAEIQALFFKHSASTTFFQFPITERFAFSHAARLLLRSSLWLFADVLFFLVTGAVQIKIRVPGSEMLLFSAAAAIAVWAATLGGAITLVWMRPRFAFGRVFVFAFVSGLIGIWIASHSELVNPAAVKAAYEGAKWFLPSGWVCVLIEPWVRGSGTVSILAVTLLAGLIAATIIAARRLAAAFTFWPPDMDPPDTGEMIPEEEPPARISEVEDAIASRDFLAVRDWTRGGFIERTAARWLTPREQRVMDLALTTAPGWTRLFPYGVMLLALAPCVAAWVRGAGSESRWILGLGTFAALSMMTPLLGGKWTAFNLAPLAHRATAICNFWPVSLRELRSCIFKLNLVRFLCALPCWLFSGGIAEKIFGDHTFWGVVFAGKCWLLALALQPFFLTFKYSASTNDTSSGFWFVVLFLALSFSIVATALAAAALLFYPNQFPAWLVAVAVLALLSWLFEIVYRRFWRGQQFDLLAKTGAEPFA